MQPDATAPDDQQWPFSLKPTITYEPPDQLLANPKNWRIHPQAQQNMLRAAIGKIGWITGVIQNDTTGHLIDGHDRVENAISTNQALVPVIHVELTPEKEDIALATFDPIGMLAIADQAKIEDLIRDIPSQDVALQLLLDGLRTGTPPDLDALTAEHGEPDERAFWPIIKVAVEPATESHYQTLMRALEGEDEAAKFAALLAAAERAL